MTDDLEPRLGELLADRGRPGPSSVAALLDGIDALPRRRARPWAPAVAAVIAVALIGLAGFIAFRPSSDPGRRPVPPDPAAFAGDPRMDACFAVAGEVKAAFEMRHARDYQRHLPGMLRAPELEVDDPALVVVFAGDVPIVGVRRMSGPGKIVCILVGDTPNVYDDVDVTGLRAIVPASSDDPGPASPTPVPTATSAAGPTVAPAPTWVADLAGQLECDGPVSELGHEVEVFEPMEPMDTPDERLEGLLTVGEYRLPAGGFEPAQVEGHWALHRYLVDGRLKAIVVSTNQFPLVPEEIRWDVVGLRACDPSEFDPADGLTDGTTIWFDADGQRAAAEWIFSRPGPGHCGWEAVTFLHFEAKLYLRDVQGVLSDKAARPFRTVDALPADATDSGLRTTKWHLFTVPDERFVYVRTSDGTIERWARGDDGFGCV